MLINDPETLAELRALDPKYERALVNTGVDTPTRTFWASPHVMRFGIALRFPEGWRIVAAHVSVLP